MHWSDIILIFISLVIGGLITYYFTFRLKLEVEKLNTILLKTGIVDFGIKLLFDNKEYDKPLVVYDLQIINRGNRDISDIDVEKNIKLSAPTGYRIIKAVESKENNSDIGSIKQDTDASIIFDLKSIKKSEKIKFQVFVLYEEFQGNEDNFSAPPLIVTSRIKNIDEIKYYEKPPLGRISLPLLFLSFLLGSIFIILTIFVEPFRIFIESKVKIVFLFKFIPLIGAISLMLIPIFINMLIRKIFP